MKNRKLLLIAVFLLITIVPMTLVACNHDNEEEPPIDYSQYDLTGAYTSVVNTPNGSMLIALKLFQQGTYEMRIELRYITGSLEFVTETGEYSYAPTPSKPDNVKAGLFMQFNGENSVGYYNKNSIYVNAGFITDNIMKEWLWIYQINKDDTTLMTYHNLKTEVIYPMSYVPFTYDVIYKTNAGGRIEGETAQRVQAGNDASEVTAVADEGYTFVCWSDRVRTATRKDTNIRGNIEVTALFECTSPQYTLTYRATEGGRIEGETSQKVMSGKDASEVTAIADEGYIFVGWSDGEKTATRKDTNISGDINVTALFECTSPQYTLTYRATEGGRIEGETSQKVMSGKDANEVTAIADEDYTFVGWSDGVKTATRKDTNISGDINVTAQFEKQQYTLTYKATEGGRIDGETSQKVMSGKDASEVTAIADEDYIFVGWSDGVKTATRKDTNISGDINVTALFVYQSTQYTLTYKATEGGRIDGETSQSVLVGKDASAVTAIADEGYTFVGWSDGVKTATRKDTNISGDINVTALFEYKDSAKYISFVYREDIKGYAVNRYNGEVAVLTIPSTYRGVPVVAINRGAFWGCSSLTSVIIPNSVTIIESSAFYNCSSLTSVTIPDSVTSIESSAFYGCSSLTSVTIPNSVTTIEQQAFDGCSSLTSVTIPNSVTTIESSAFSGCSSLTSVTIPNSVTSIYGGAFAYCNSLTSVIIPNSVTSIGYEAFSGCTSLTSVTIPNSVTSINSNAFGGCTALNTMYIESSAAANHNEIGYLLQYVTDVYILADIEITASIYDNVYINNGETIVNGKTYIYYKIKGE